jgi:hypothetical protein
MIVKLVRTRARTDGSLMVDAGGETLANAYLAKGWTILGVFQGSQNDEVCFVLRQDQMAAAAEVLEEAQAIDTSELSDVH